MVWDKMGHKILLTELISSFSNMLRLPNYSVLVARNVSGDCPKRPTPRILRQAPFWIPTVGYFSLAALFATLYFCEWKTFLQYMPYYNLGYKKKDKDDSK